LLIGEVKTSSDAKIPPNVMHGAGGLSWQLQTNALDRGILLTIVKWLRMRCTTPENVAAYQAAVRRFLGTQELLLVGVLLRDTQPDERDVQGRATHLGNTIAKPKRVELLAWYLPVPIANWSAIAGGSP